MRAVLLFLSFTLGVTASAQYSTDKETFLEQIESRLGDSDRKKTKKFMEAFEPNWMTNFTTENQQRVIATCNLLESKYRPAFPDIYGYLISVHSFILSRQQKSSFEAWHSTIDALLNSKNTSRFQNFITICEGFFTDRIIYSSPKHIWKAKYGEYMFQFEDNRPTIRFEGVELVCYIINRSTRRKRVPYLDQLVVRKTSGTYEPFTHKWTGQGGTVDWERTGLDPEKNYAQITDYVLSVKQTKLECDSVTTYSDYHEQPLQGSFKDMAKIYNQGGEKTYPSFTSFEKQIVRKNILPEVDYVGGIGISGSNFVGVGYDKKPATLTFYRDGKPFVKTAALQFKINERRATARDCRVVMYTGKEDSLFHSGLNLDYAIEQEGKVTSLEMMRGSEGLAQAPFKDSYHQLEMYVDRIIWVRGDPNLRLTWHRNTPNKVAKFESYNYYSQRIYNQIQGMAQQHPLVSLRNYAQQHRSNVIPVNAIASTTGYTKTQAIPILLNLANQGFVTYNSFNEEVTVQPKIEKYIDARSGKSDYDHIVLNCNFLEIRKKTTMSSSDRENKQNMEFNEKAERLNQRKEQLSNFGVFNLSSMELLLNEVEPVQLSPSRHVVVFPHEGKLTVTGGLNFQFGGAVMAGKLEVYLDRGVFDYTTFRLNLLETEAALLRVRPIFGGGEKLMPMYSRFEKVKGYIAIDDTTNRSGVKKRRFHQYPVFNTTSESYVFYDDPFIYNGIYDSADFYFEVEPFELDSLNSFDERAMAFKGELHSAGIFPVIKEKISLQKDYSFGFKTNAPEVGYALYGDYCSFDDEITLSAEGLNGSGTIDFLTSTSSSKKFTFFPDSAVGVSSYVNKEQEGSNGKAEFPQVKGEQVVTTFMPRENLLKVQTTKYPLVFFGEKAIMNGITYLTSEEMTGRGYMYFQQAELGARKFSYSRQAVNSDTADFNLAQRGDVEGEDLGFNAINLQAYVDFEEGRGQFVSNGQGARIEFPKNQYLCYMHRFDWVMETDKISMVDDAMSGRGLNIGSEKLVLTEPNFFSMNPDQDSLRFIAPLANYDPKRNILYCKGVDHVDVADVRIFPGDKQLTIRKNAEMDPLEGAKIWANVVNRYHKISEAEIQINSRKDYRASGKYVVKTKTGDQVIFLHDIRPDDELVTRAKGRIEKDEQFQLSDRFDFYGKVELIAYNRSLTFDGATRIKHSCEQFPSSWLKFRSEIDINNIQIPISTKLIDAGNKPIAIGIMRRNPKSSEQISIYPTFLSAQKDSTDYTMFTSSGVLVYNEEAGEFRITNIGKLVDPKIKGNYIALNVENCSIEGEGYVDMVLNLPDVAFKPYGKVHYASANKQTAMELSGGPDFYMDKDIMEYIAEDIKSVEDLPNLAIKRTNLLKAIAEATSEAKAKMIEEEYATQESYLGMIKMPEQMKIPFYFTHLHLKWNDQIKGFVSEPVTDIVSIFSDPIFKTFSVRCVIQYAVEKDVSGTTMGLLVELPKVEEKGGNYYFFNFEQKKLNTLVSITSSNSYLKSYMKSLKSNKLGYKNLLFELQPNTDRMTVFKTNFKGEE